jgi:hypothetical protein
MSKTQLYLALMFVILSCGSNSWGDDAVYPPAYSIMSQTKMKDPLAVNTSCIPRNGRYNVRESFKDALEAQGPYAQGTSPLIYTLLEYHVEIQGGEIKYCYSYTLNTNVLR